MTWRQAMQQQRTTMVGARSHTWTMHRSFTKHVACSEVGKVGAELGQIWAESDIGPKTKFDLHGLLYNLHLGTMVIRVVD